MNIRILIADDHAIMRDGLRMILESLKDIEVVSEAGNGREALEKAEVLMPDVVIMDISMPELNGIEATRIILERLPATKIIILSMHHTQEYVFRALQAGCQAYLLKESAGPGVVDAVRAVMRGQRYFSDGIEIPAKALRMGISSNNKSPIESLSPREREVIQLVVEGKSSSEIATILSLSTKSIETYRCRLMQKLGIKNVPSLVKFSLLHGITPTE